MSEQEKFERFMQRVLIRPLPANPMARVRVLSRELAEGALDELWDSTIFAPYRRTSDEGKEGFQPQNSTMQKYLTNRWNNSYPNLQLLRDSGFLSQRDKSNFTLNETAFNLTQSAEILSSFISYRRKESSAFALLILKSLKEHSLDPFIDMALIPGEDWHAGLKERIQQHGYDCLILVLGQDTLSSPYVLDEVDWAMEAGLTIIPVWHNDFEYKSADWGNIPVKIDKMLQNTHAIRVREESALDYNTAIVELLNRFGITP